MATLSASQLLVLKTDITVTKSAIVYEGQTLLQWWTSGNNHEISEFYQLIASPQVDLWIPTVGKTELINSLVGQDFLNLTIAQQNLWFVMTQPENCDTTLSRVRQNFVDIFGGGSATTTNLLSAVRRPGSYGEELFSIAAPGPGTANVSDIYGQVITPENVASSRLAV
jgi:hypothetical protein